MFFLELVKDKVSYIFRLITTTPHYGWIIVIQFLSGFFSIAGISLLVPVLEYIRTNVPAERNLSYLRVFENIFGYFGIEPSFPVVLGAACLLILSGQILVFTSAIIAEYTQFSIAGEYRKRIFNSYITADWLWLSCDKSGEMNHAIMREAETAGLAHLNSQRIVIYSMQVLAFLFISAKLSLIVTIMALAVYGLLFFVNSVNSHYVRSLAEDFNETSKMLSSATANLSQNKKFFKASLLYEWFMKRVFNYVEKIIRTMRKKKLREELQISWTFLFSFTFLVSLIVFRRALNIGFSELLVVILVFQRLSPEFNSLFSTYLALNSNMPVHQSIITRLKELNENRENNGREMFQYDNSIRFENVCFGYPGNGETVKNINLEIKPFQTTAFIGSSGAGKSTILDLITGLLKPESGMIYYGSIPHSQLNVIIFRNKVDYVGQETTLLDGSLLENLTIGYPEATEQMVEDICKKIHMYELVRGLPKGIHTEIGENGLKLSGGQRQRVALGRALFIKPRILILDEATSDLDTETEMLIQETIQSLCQHITIIIVAHRLSTVKSADTIYVVENGSICESGNYQELLRQKGRLFYLDSLQK